MASAAATLCDEIHQSRIVFVTLCLILFCMRFLMCCNVIKMELHFVLGVAPCLQAFLSALFLLFLPVSPMDITKDRFLNTLWIAAVAWQQTEKITHCEFTE